MEGVGVVSNNRAAKRDYSPPKLRLCNKRKAPALGRGFAGKAFASR